jgi:hypothetical protein
MPGFAFLAGGEDDEATWSLDGVSARRSGWEADQVASFQGPAARRLTQRGCARQNKQPLLDSVVVVVGPSRVAGFGGVNGRGDSRCAKPLADGGGGVTEAGYVHARVQLNAEDV